MFSTYFYLPYNTQKSLNWVEETSKRIFHVEMVNRN